MQARVPEETDGLYARFSRSLRESLILPSSFKSPFLSFLLILDSEASAMKTDAVRGARPMIRETGLSGGEAREEERTKKNEEQHAMNLTSSE